MIRSEWIKLRSVRSTVVTLGLTAGAVVAALGVLVSMLSNGAPIAADGEAIYDPAGNSLFGVNARPTRARRRWARWSSRRSTRRV